MSFTTRREYSRPILQPLRVVSNDANGVGTSSAALRRDLSQSQSPSSPSPLWHATTHVFRGTGNRVTSQCWPPANFDRDPSHIPDDAKYDQNYDPATAAKQPGKSIYEVYERNNGPQQLNEAVPAPWLVVKRYIPVSSGNSETSITGVTLLILPGMGIPKEMFEPHIELLLPRLQRSGVHVREIWSVDMPMSGQTALVNPRGYLYGNEKDITRDLLLFITAYLPLEPTWDLPEQLESRKPLSGGNIQQYPVRKHLHVLAHSLGAQCAMMIAAHTPELFSSLTVMDPAVIPPGPVHKAYAKLSKDLFCTNIAETHADVGTLAASLRSNRRTRGWADACIRTFSNWGAVPNDGRNDNKDGNRKGSIRLTAPSRLEWALYYDKETPTQTYDRLQDISVPFNAIMPPRPFAVPPKQFESDVARMAQTRRITWISDTTHQIPFEKPKECVDAIASWLESVGLPDRAHL